MLPFWIFLTSTSSHFTRHVPEVILSTFLMTWQQENIIFALFFYQRLLVEAILIIISLPGFDSHDERLVIGLHGRHFANDATSSLVKSVPLKNSVSITSISLAFYRSLSLASVSVLKCFWISIKMPYLMYTKAWIPPSKLFLLYKMYINNAYK